MKYAKMLGLLVMAAAALMAFAGSASATELTVPVNKKLAVGEKIHATAEAPVKFDWINVTCQNSTIEGKITQAGGVNTTVEGNIEVLTFEECGNNTVTVPARGTFTVHTEYTTEASGEEKEKTTNTGNGTVTSNGAEITFLSHNILGTVHCLYKTKNTDLGTLTGSVNTGGTATLDVSATIAEVPTDDFCEEHIIWTGNYRVNIPDYLDVD